MTKAKPSCACLATSCHWWGSNGGKKVSPSGLLDLGDQQPVGERQGLSVDLAAAGDEHLVGRAGERDGIREASARPRRRRACQTGHG